MTITRIIKNKIVETQKGKWKPNPRPMQGTALLLLTNYNPVK